jgi:hypothetical protein
MNARLKLLLGNQSAQGPDETLPDGGLQPQAAICRQRFQFRLIVSGQARHAGIQGQRFAGSLLNRVDAPIDNLMPGVSEKRRG